MQKMYAAVLASGPRAELSSAIYSNIHSKTIETKITHNDFVKLVVLDKIPTSSFLEFVRFLFLEYHHIYKIKKGLYSDLL